MKPEEFKVGVKFRYMGQEHVVEYGMEQTLKKYQNITVETDFGIEFDTESVYASDCILISEPEKLYPASEVEKIREASFEAGRELKEVEKMDFMEQFTSMTGGGSIYQYKDYKDYSESNPLK